MISRYNCKISLTAFITVILTMTLPAANIPILFQQEQVLAQTTADRKAEADRLLQQGIKQYQTTQFEAALQSWQQALTIYRQIKDRLGKEQSLGNLGIAYQALGDYAKAIEYEQQSLAIAREIKDRFGEEQSLGNLGIAYQALGDYTKAIDYQQQRLTIAREIKYRLGEEHSLGSLGIAYDSLGEYAKAIEYQQQSLTIAREIKDRKGEGQSLGNLGVAYDSLGEYAKAIEYQQQSLTIAREIKDRLGEEQSLGNLGVAYQALGEYAKAIEYQQQSLAIAREIKDPKGEEQSLGNLGLAYNYLGDYAKAIDYQQQRLAIARELKDRKGEGQSLGNLGLAYNYLGEYAKAIEYQQQSLAIAREIKDPKGEGQSLGNLGIAYYYLGDYTKAIDYQQQSLAIAREIKDPKGEGDALGNLGSVYQALGDYAKAIDYQQQRLAIAREIKDPKGEEQFLGSMGNAYNAQGNYANAIDYYQQSLVIAREIKDPKGEGQSLDNLGIAYYSLGDYAKAIEYEQQGLAIAREIKDHNGEGLSLNNLGAAYEKSGNLKAAETTLLTGIEVWESLRGQLGKNDTYKVSIFEEQARTYRTLQQVLIAENQTNDALEISERGRSRAFVELLTSHLSNKSASQPPEKPTIPLLQQIAKQQNATLVEYSIIYDDFKIQSKEETKESELYIWVIKPTGEVTFRKADLKPLWQKDNTTLAELVTISRESIGARGRGGIVVGLNPDAPKAKQRLQQLHQLLIAPIADLLPKQETEKVIFIPQSSLFLVPFPALLDEQGKYLIEKHTILTAPSIQVLDLTHKQRHGNIASSLQNPLIVGNPTMPKVILEPGQPAQQLTNLPSAEKEAKYIASLLKTQAITGNKATKAAIVEKMSQAGIVHLATHGILDDYRGIGSAVALAPSGKDDGLLTADEILNLKLKADLIVLSACDTGRGRITGDGVIGLSRSLISAGVPSVIVSLWAVDDNSTSFLMTEFYKNLQQKLDKATALRKAMLTTMQQKDYVNPLQWAAFTLIGESE